MDLVYVSYNSSKWVESCFRSIICSDFNLKSIHVYVLDNSSTDDTLDKLYHCKEKYQDALGSFEVIPSDINYGFGKGNNIAFSQGNSDIVCFFNIDPELRTDTLARLDESSNPMKMLPCGNCGNFRMSILKFTIRLLWMRNGAAVLRLL